MDAILLAAGNSVRFGENKLLYPLNQKPVYRYILEQLYQKQREGRLTHLLVVSRYEEIFRDVNAHFPGVEAVKNPASEQGISGSIRLGLKRLKEISDTSEACLFAVADQPGLTGESLEKMISFWQEHSWGIVAAAPLTGAEELCFEEQESQGNRKKGAWEETVREEKQSGEEKIRTGNPVIFSSRYYEELKALEGDVGGKQVLRRHREDVGYCGLPRWELRDLDTREALEFYRTFLQK